MGWRVAKSLDTLLGQINALSPNRDKSSDGGIGNAEHASRSSDHNPWVMDANVGIVTARDFTNDPAHGVNSQDLADTLVASRDPRIKYVISNRKICSGSGQDKPAWVWRPYTGTNPHNHHCHVSVKSDKPHYDSTVPWEITLGKPTVSAPAVIINPVLRKGSKGPDVTRLQKLLIAHGASLTPDVDFGVMTENAVKDYQKDHELVADGVVGKYTWDSLEIKL